MQCTCIYVHVRTHTLSTDAGKYKHKPKELLSKLKRKMTAEDTEKESHSTDRPMGRETTPGKCCVNYMGDLAGPKVHRLFLGVCVRVFPESEHQKGVGELRKEDSLGSGKNSLLCRESE